MLCVFFIILQCSSSHRDFYASAGFNADACFVLQILMVCLAMNLMSHQLVCVVSCCWSDECDDTVRSELHLLHFVTDMP